MGSFGWRLTGGLLFASAAAGAQPVSPATASPGVQTATDALEEQAATRVAAAVCSQRVVLLGELPEHGEARGFGVKARIVERLVGRCGFRARLFEAGSYDFFGFERAIASTPQASSGLGAAARTDSLELSLARAIGGFWWTRGSRRMAALARARGGRRTRGDRRARRPAKRDSGVCARDAARPRVGCRAARARRRVPGRRRPLPRLGLHPGPPV